ncbi:hypothetical protein [Amycolatopsis sp.]|uniref:Rv0361 family membrane protein n=1 Tax=Amycolatopsis sp. TaxID=37632 RepID=UPI002BEDBDB6|nr:hypothetical protein [Amycolatopsis sp.]HVV10678.1 hypothetical protein [Amycolatopsis sp.]
MTQPPAGQFPQPGPYGQPAQPGPYGPQAGGFPPSGPQPQPGHPGAPQQPFNAFAEPHQQVRQDPWGQPPGAFQSFPGGAPAGPPRKKTGLIIGIVVAVVVIVAGGVTALLVLTGGDDTSSPKGTAQAAVDALNKRDAKAYAALVCTAPKQSDVDQLAQEWQKATDLHATVSGDATVTGSTAKVPVTVTQSGETKTSDIPLKQQDSKWCIDD